MPSQTSPLLSLAFWCSWSCLLSARPTVAPFALALVAPSTRPASPRPTRFSIAPLAAAADSDGTDAPAELSHADVEWRLRPFEGTSRLDRLKVKLGANILRLENKLRGGNLPPLLCPKGGRALLEAYYKEPGKMRKKKIARFGFTTARGPSSPDIDATIKEIYNIDPPPLSATIAAIIYMFVEPEYRGRNVGGLALEAISAIHAVQAVDFTVLVADDDGSGGLVRWYEGRGFARAPRMQNVLGSPDERFGVAMIAPVQIEEGFFERCRVKWW